MTGVPPSGSGHSPKGEAAISVASPAKPSVPNAAAILLYELHESAVERETFAVACDGSNRKNAWLLEKLGLVRWCGTNWGSHFFQITDEGKAFIDAEVAELSARLASAIEARSDAAPKSDAAEGESAAPSGETPRG